MKITPRSLFKSILLQVGGFTLARDFALIVRARLGLIHESDYRYFKPSKKFFRIADIGANTGQSLIALRSKFPNSIIECFEPNPACHLMLHYVRRIVGGEVIIREFGLGSVQGQIEFFTPVMNNTIELLQEGSFDRSQFTAEATLQRIGSEFALKSRLIEVRVMDSMHADFDILKLDVQGFEWDVLQGSADTILRCKPIIFVERDDRNQDRITKYLTEKGYRLSSGVLNDIYWYPDRGNNNLLIDVVTGPT